MRPGKFAIAGILRNAQASAQQDEVSLIYIGKTSRTSAQRHGEEDRVALLNRDGLCQRTLSFALAHLSHVPGVVHASMTLCQVPLRILTQAEGIIAHVLRLQRATSINRASCGGDVSQAQPEYAADETTVLSLICYGSASQHPGTRFPVSHFHVAASYVTGFKPACKRCCSAINRKRTASQREAQGLMYRPHVNANGEDPRVRTKKTCTKCGEKKLLEEFNHKAHKGATDGRASMCRVCDSASNIARRVALGQTFVQSNSVRTALVRTEKICTKCKTLKPLAHFSKDSNSKDKHCSRCQNCMHEYANAANARKRQKREELARTEK
jgi:hypothetical protein